MKNLLPLIALQEMHSMCVCVCVCFNLSVNQIDCSINFVETKNQKAA